MYFRGFRSWGRGLLFCLLVCATNERTRAVLELKKKFTVIMLTMNGPSDLPKKSTANTTHHHYKEVVDDQIGHGQKITLFNDYLKRLDPGTITQFSHLSFYHLPTSISRQRLPKIPIPIPNIPKHAKQPLVQRDAATLLRD